MKLNFSKRDNLILAAAALLLLIVVAYGQFFYLTTLKSELATKQQSLQTDQRFLAVAMQKKAVTTKTHSVNTTNLQRKLPVKPLEDQFILDLEKAETISDSSIKSMSFSKDQDVSLVNSQGNAQNANGQQNPSATVNQESTTQTSSQGTANQSTSNQMNVSTSQAHNQAEVSPIAGLKKLTVNLNVESPSYEQFEKFIQTLESLERIVVVESINYTGGNETTSVDQGKQKLAYSLVISTFYMPTLADLQAQLPKLDAPAPAGKDNPLSQFPDLSTSH